MAVPSRRGQRRSWAVAAVLSLFLHLAAITTLTVLPALSPVAAPPDASSPVEIVLVPLPDDEPTFFTELPEELADEPAEDPEFLSNVDSRARDDVPAGDEDMPRLQGPSEAPHLALSDGVPEPPAAAEPEAQESPSPPDENRSDQPGQSTLRQQLASRAVELRSFGNNDIRQEPMDNPRANTPLFGDISLSTTAWDYAPWLQKFRRDVMSRWHPPGAYFMGLIDGWVTARLEISAAGELLRLDVIGADVDHSSLTEAVVYALEAPAPYRSLPDHFPDDRLVLQIRFVYPQRTRR